MTTTKIKEKVTLIEVAEAAGVSLATASLALRTPPAKNIGAKTVKKVLKAASDLNYQGDFFASQLNREKKQILMLYIKSFQDLYCSTIADSFEYRANERNYKTLISVMGNRSSFDKDILGPHAIQAAVFVGSNEDMVAQKDLEKLAKQGVRIVMVGRDFNSSKISFVLCDNYIGGQLAAEQIYDNNPGKVWIIACEDLCKKVRLDRIQGFRDYVQDQGFEEPQIIKTKPANNMRDIAKITYDTILKEFEKPDFKCPNSIFCTTDARSLGLLQALYVKGIKVGQDTQVIGYDDIWPTEFTSPGLTTIHQPLVEMGAIAADTIIDNLEAEKLHPRKIILPPELNIRQSTF